MNFKTYLLFVGAQLTKSGQAQDSLMMRPTFTSFNDEEPTMFLAEPLELEQYQEEDLEFVDEPYNVTEVLGADNSDYYDEIEDEGPIKLIAKTNTNQTGNGTKPAHDDLIYLEIDEVFLPDMQIPEQSGDLNDAELNNTESNNAEQENQTQLSSLDFSDDIGARSFNSSFEDAPIDDEMLYELIDSSNLFFEEQFPDTYVGQGPRPQLIDCYSKMNCPNTANRQYCCAEVDLYLVDYGVEDTQIRCMVNAEFGQHYFDTNQYGKVDAQTRCVSPTELMMMSGETPGSIIDGYLSASKKYAENLKAIEASILVLATSIYFSI